MYVCLQALDNHGSTPLLAATRNGHFEVVEWLLAHVARLPSISESREAFHAPMPAYMNVTIERTKCILLITEVSLRKKLKNYSGQVLWQNSS